MAGSVFKEIAMQLFRLSADLRDVKFETEPHHCVHGLNGQFAECTHQNPEDRCFNLDVWHPEKSYRISITVEICPFCGLHAPAESRRIRND